VLRQAVGAGHDVTVFVRTPSKLSPEVRERVSVHTGDLRALVPLDSVRGQDALIPQMIVPYADAAALMLANLDRGNAMSRHRVGLAPPVGMRERKPRRSAEVNPTAQ
jgi:putative NADH-flavin reductase